MDMNSVLYGEGWQPGVTTAPMPQAEAPAAPPTAPVQLAQAPVQAPVQAPANQQQYEQDWLTKMRTDPAISQAMMFAASRLMQGQRPGQSQAGMLGDALAVGMTAHSMLTENERKAGLEERKVTSEEQYKAAHTEGQQIANEDARAMGPDKIKALKLKIQALERTEDVEKARAPYERLKAQFLSMAAQDSTGQIERVWLDELQSPMLERQGKQNLQAAQTRQANAQAGLYEAQAENPEKFSRGGSTATGAMVQSRKQLLEMYKAANPTATDQELNQMVLDHEGKQKRKAAESEFVDFAYKGGFDLSTEKGMQKAQAAYANVQKAFGKKPMDVGGGESAGGKGKAPTQADWDKARTSVGVGETYTGPDGKTYTRKN